MSNGGCANNSAQKVVAGQTGSKPDEDDDEGTKGTVISPLSPCTSFFFSFRILTNVE
jgi:hypothetical protein